MFRNANWEGPQHRVDELDALIQVTGLAAIRCHYDNPFNAKAAICDDRYGGCEVFEMLTMNEAFERRERTSKLDAQLIGIFKDIYAALTDDKFHMWLGGLYIDNSGHYQGILSMIFQYPCLVQCQLFLQCHVPLFKHHLEIEPRDFPGERYMYLTFRTLRMLEDLRRIQFYTNNEDKSIIMCLLLCLSRPAPFKVFRNAAYFLQRYDGIRYLVCTYLKVEYVKIMY
tara:strand:+ start:5773 stop:6450 length:678 start_codon:yes stop_codon:yes gene_type:complete